MVNLEAGVGAEAVAVEEVAWYHQRLKFQVEAEEEAEEEHAAQGDYQTVAVVAVEVRREDSHQEAFRIVVHVVVVQGVFQIVAAAVEEGEAEAKYKRLKDTNTSEGK